MAVTLSFDDGVIDDLPLLERLNKWGLKATWNLNSGQLSGTHSKGSRHVAAPDVARIYAGHEVAIHSVSHPHLPALDSAGVAREILEDRIALEDLVGYPVRGMAYPFGTYNRRVIDTLRGLGIVYARTVENRWDCFPPEEPLAWPTTCHQYDPELPAKWAASHGNEQHRGLFFVWGHSYEFQNANDWSAADRIFKPLSSHADVWYCTNIELFDYDAARQRIAIAANRRSAFNPSALPVTLLVDGRPVEIPPGVTMSLE
jgi:peptidoglycan/xylan/chitin deacetylase (PgdA/CDA1 family)